MRLETKTVPVVVTVKPEGRVVARVCAFGIPDKVGDIIAPGAFDTTLAQARDLNKRWPIRHEHSRRIEDHLGSANPHNSQLTPEGLQIVAEFDMNDERGRKGYQLVQQNVLTEWSIGFMLPAPECARPRPDGQRGRVLTKIELVEVSLTAKGIGDSATLEVRSMSVAAASAPSVEEQLAPWRARLDVIQQRVARRRG